MEVQEMHIRLVIALNEWDPFNLGFGNYETEIADVVQVVHTSDDPQKLARKIQNIYEFSFEQIIPIENCQTIATELLNIKNQQSCTL
ncbi:DUF1871 family protein [Bacillus sp. CGMCC 1.16607]|uniref:DUF1871 family protein n=1 Tax=Bacillus sp. CGMCC 1.16607 TaxID=3351842 RepID=UPI003634A77D